MTIPINEPEMRHISRVFTQELGINYYGLTMHHNSQWRAAAACGEKYGSEATRAEDSRHEGGYTWNKVVSSRSVKLGVGGDPTVSTL